MIEPARRKMLLGGAAALAAIAAPAAAQQTAAVTLVKSLYAAFGKGDVATIVSACAGDVDWEVVGRSSDAAMFGPRKGPQGVKDFFDLVGASFEFKEFAPLEFHATGTTVIALGRYTIAVRKTSKSFSSSWCHVFTLADGKLARFREFTDTARVAEALKA